MLVERQTMLISFRVLIPSLELGHGLGHDFRRGRRHGCRVRSEICRHRCVLGIVCLLLMLDAALVVSMVVMVVIGLLPPGLLDGCALLDAGVMRLPLELGLGREGQDAFHRLAGGDG